MKQKNNNVYLITLVASFLGNKLSGKQAIVTNQGRGVIRVRKGTVRLQEDF